MAHRLTALDLSVRDVPCCVAKGSALYSSFIEAQTAVRTLNVIRVDPVNAQSSHFLHVML